MPRHMVPRLAAATLATAAALVPTASAHAATSVWDGTVRIPNCSGSVVRLPGARDLDKALVLANGHCVAGADLGHGDVMTNTPVDAAHSTAYLVKADAAGEPGDGGQATLTKVVYATMTDTDVALFETSSTYAALAMRGIRPRTLATSGPAVNAPVSVVSTYWGTAWTGCRVSAVQPVHTEGPWRWTNTLALGGSGCTGFAKGASGSPVLEADGRVVAVLNTANPTTGAGFAQQTAPVTTCVDKGRFTLAAPTCTLPGGAAHQG